MLAINTFTSVAKRFLFINKFKRVNHCMFLSSSKEPEYMVDTDTSIDPKLVKITYLPDSVRMEMWKNHKENPDEWSILKLSQHYGTSLDRTKAVLFLMKRREDFISVDINILKKYEKSEEMWNKKLNEPEKYTHAVLAEEYGLSVKEVDEIMFTVKQRNSRQENLDFSITKTENYLKELETFGIKTSFQENQGNSGQGKLSDTYFPELFGDDEYEEQKRRLLKRIKTETKSTLSDEMESFLNLDSTVVDPAAVTHPKEISQEKDIDVTKSRWKYAYKDLSTFSKLKSVPTMIRTRHGRWRAATPLEELHRSWVQKPTQIDMETFRSKFDKYLDFDGDDATASALVADRLQRHKALRSARQDKK